MSHSLNIAVFTSGKGSNFKAILGEIKSGKIRNTEIALVISNNSDAGALSIARESGIPAYHISRKQFGSDEEFNSELLSVLRKHDANFIALAGYMKKIGPVILREYKNRIINIHPALLPEFGGTGMYGMHVHEAVIKSGARISGATVHMVDEEYDHGSIIVQKSVPVEENDTPETLAARVLKVEHEIYPYAIRLFADGKIKNNGNTITMLN